MDEFAELRAEVESLHAQQQRRTSVLTSSTLSKSYVKHLTVKHVYSPAPPHASVAKGEIHIAQLFGTKVSSCELVEGGLSHQAFRALQNLEEVLSACKRTSRDLVHVGVYIRDLDMERSRSVDQVFQRWSAEHPIVCARSVVGVTWLP